jgi:hypothetical protein
MKEIGSQRHRAIGTQNAPEWIATVPSHASGSPKAILRAEGAFVQSIVLIRLGSGAAAISEKVWAEIALAWRSARNS